MGLAISRDDLGAPLSAAKYPVLTTLFRKGIRGFFEIAKQNFAFTPRRNDYINKCDLCNEMRTHLVLDNYNNSDELEPREFYLKS